MPYAAFAFPTEECATRNFAPEDLIHGVLADNVQHYPSGIPLAGRPVYPLTRPRLPTSSTAPPLR